MLIICAGMQKSGSAYFYNTINDLLIASGHADAREVKEQYNLASIMKGPNNNIGKPTITKLFPLLRISERTGTFLIKTHVGPTPSVHLLARMGKVRVIYSYRDPRDVLLSAIDHGQRLIDSGKFHTFASMIEFNEAARNVLQWLKIWNQYQHMDQALSLKYETMMESPFETIAQIEEHLSIEVHNDTKKDILWKYSRDNNEAIRDGMHFNKAITFRYKTEMNTEQLEKCNQLFGSYLKAMDYDIK